MSEQTRPNPSAVDETSPRKKRYDAALRVVALNSSPMQPPGVRPETVKQLLAPEYEPDRVRSALRAAGRNGDLVPWRDESGVPRYTLATEPDLRRLLGELVEWEEVDRDLVGRVNRRLMEVQE